MKINDTNTFMIQPTFANSHLQISERTKGWPGSGFKTQTTVLKIRRVNSNGRDEAQIEVEIFTTTEKNTNIKYGNICIPADKIDEVIDALKNVRKLEA